MAKARTAYACTECGGRSSKWQGQCPHCSAWNTLVETVATPAATRFHAVAGAVGEVRSLASVEARADPRSSPGR
jgi:DNA repair protein RadA/Sms